MATFPFSKRFRQRHPRFSRSVLLLCSFAVACIVGFVYASWALVCRGGRCPSAAALQGYEPKQTSKLYAANGAFIAQLGLERRTVVAIGQIPPIVRDAFVVTEDKRFYRHAGVDWLRVPGAILADLRSGGYSEGGSTITMQLARNIFPEQISSEKTLVRKLKEAKVARQIERLYPKDKILELYLNQIYLGNGAYGVEAASQRYFGRSVRGLDVAQAATLAALPRAPEYYNPVRHPDEALARRNLVIGFLQDAGKITAAQASAARAEPLRLAHSADSTEVAPYFVEWIREQLEDKFGSQLYDRGLKVYTTLDLGMQQAAERALERQARAIEAGRYGRFAHPTYASYTAHAQNDDNGSDTSPYLQGAFIAMDPRTGAVRALVGGRDFDDSKFDRAVQAMRQPGSTFKPILYSDAIQNGRPLSYLLDDAPMTVQLGPHDTWSPHDYEASYEGNIPMRRALYESRNIPAVRMGIELGTQSVIDEARKFGITTPIPGYPSIFIGAADVLPIEMVSAFTTFATLGTRAAPMAITRVVDQDGNVVWEPQPVTVPVLSPEEAWLMVSVLEDVVRRGTAASSVGAEFHLPAGGKTGTTNDGTDVWFIGFTPDLVAGVWMGFDKPAKIQANAQGGLLAAPAWTAFMNDVYRNRPAPAAWPMPAGIVTRRIDVSTGQLATPYCPLNLVTNEYYISGTEPLEPCSVHTPNGTLVPDTSGVYPAPTYPASPYPPGGPPMQGPPVPVDSGLPPGSAIVPGAPAPIRPGRPARRDTSRAFRDSVIFGAPARDTSRAGRLRDSLRDTLRLDSLRRQPARPDTSVFE